MIAFTKAHACGNDFLIVTEEAAGSANWAELTVRLCERNTGIGADGIEFFAWTGPKSGRITLHNADGSIAEISGNGTRTVAAWMAAQTDAQSGDEMTITTEAGDRVCRIVERSGNTVLVTAGMGVPKFHAKTVTLADGTEVAGTVVDTGNPHFVIVVDNAEFAVAGRSWQEIGKAICFHSDFPQQTNVEFARIIDAAHAELRIFERGVGPTTSSGTGTSATSTTLIGRFGATSPLIVTAPGGAQTVAWNGEGAELFLTGPASLIAEGEAW